MSKAENPAQAPTSFLEIVSDGFPVLHGLAALLIVLNRLPGGLAHF
jgi:hypothetical protein